MTKISDWRAGARRPISRHDAVEYIRRGMDGFDGVFNSQGSRPTFLHSPDTYCPRISISDLDALEKKLAQSFLNIRRAIEEDVNIPEKIPSDPALRDRCPCCGDDGRDGAKNWKDGHCQKCREAGCYSQTKCVRPPAHEANYHPGDDAPHGWGHY